MLKEVLLPDLGEGIESADVSEVLVSVGDSVSTDDIFLVLESDKASMEIPAENNGKVKEVFVKAGDKVKTGSPLISLEVSSDVESSIKPEVKEVKARLGADAPDDRRRSCCPTRIRWQRCRLGNACCPIGRH